jgi:hypothetical protein
MYLNSRYGRGQKSGSLLSVGKQASRVANYKRDNNIIDNIIEEKKMAAINSRALLIVDKSFETRFLPLLRHLIDIGYISDSINIKVVEDNVVNVEASINEHYDNGGRLFFGTQKSSTFFDLRTWFEKHPDALYFNSGSKMWITRIDHHIPDNMITTSCNHSKIVDFIFDNIICNIHKHADFLYGSSFDNIFDFVDDSLPDGQVFNQIVYVSDNTDLRLKNNFIETIQNYIQTNFPEDTQFNDKVTLQTFVLNIEKDISNNNFVFPDALDKLLSENQINGNKFASSKAKSIFIFDCFDSANCQNMLNYFSKKEYANNLIIFNEKFLDLNVNDSLPFYTNFDFAYSFILAVNYSELGYKSSRHIFGDYSTPLHFIDIFSHLLDIFERVVGSKNKTPVNRLLEYLKNSFSIDRNEWHVKPLYLYGLKERYDDVLKRWSFYSSATIFKKSFNDTNTGTAGTDESWIDTAIDGYPSAPGNTTYNTNLSAYNSSNANFLNTNLNGVSMLFSSMQEITDYTNDLDGFFKGTYKSSTYNGGANPNSTPYTFGIWKVLTDSGLHLNTSSVTPFSINVTVPYQALIDGTTTNKNYWLYIHNGPITYSYTSYNQSGSVIGTFSDTVTIDIDLTYSANNYIVFFNKGNNYNGIRGPLVINFTLSANQIVNKQYRIGDVISLSSSTIGTNVNASIDSISSDGFSFGVTRFENENSNGITSSVLKQNTGAIMLLANQNSIAYLNINIDITNVANNLFNLWSANGCYYLALLPSGILVANDFRTGQTFWYYGNGFSNPGPSSLRFRVIETTVNNPSPQAPTNNYYIELNLLDTTGAERVEILKKSVNFSSLIYPLQLVVTNDRNIAIVNASGNILWDESSNIILSLGNGNYIGNGGNYGSLYSLNGKYNLALGSNGVLNFTQINSSSIYNAGTISQCSGWSNVYNLFKNNTASYAWNNYNWIWNTANSYSSAPVGTVNFYTSYTNTRSTDITATLWCSVDDTLDIYMNGNKLPNYITSWNTIISNTITLKAGVTSFFNFVATNGGGAPNPAGLIFWCLENGNTNDSTNTLFFSNNTNATTTNTIYSISNSAATTLKFSYTTNSSTSVSTFALGLYNSSNDQIYDIIKDGNYISSTTFDVENNSLVKLPFIAPYACKLSNNGDLIIVDANNNNCWSLGKADKTTVTQDLYDSAGNLTKSAITGISAVHPRQGDYATIHNPVNTQYSNATATITLVNSDKSIKAVFYDEDDSTVRSKIINEKPELRYLLVTDSGITTGQNFMPISNTELFNLVSDNKYYSASIGEDCIVRVKDNRNGRINWSSYPPEIPSGQTIQKCNGLKLDNDSGSLYVDIISENIGNSTSSSQNVKLYSNFNYRLAFYASGNSPINVNIGALNNALQPLITFTFTPTNSGLQLFTKMFSVVTNDTFTITFSSNNNNTIIQNISITNEEKYYIFQNSNISSNASSYSLNMQDDCNLCVYQDNKDGSSLGLWCTMAWQTENWYSTQGAIQAFEYWNQYVPPRLISTNGYYYLSMDYGTLGIMRYKDGGYTWVDPCFRYIGMPLFYSNATGMAQATVESSSSTKYYTVYNNGSVYTNGNNSATGGYWGNICWSGIMNTFSPGVGPVVANNAQVIWTNSTATTGTGSNAGQYLNFYYNYNNTTGKSILSQLWVSVLSSCTVYINSIKVGTVGGSSSSSWNNLSKFDFKLPPGNTTFKFVAYNSSGKAGLAFLCIPKYISSCDLFISTSTGNLMVQNVTILTEDNYNVSIHGVTDLAAYSITNFTNTGPGPYTMSFDDDGVGGSDGTLSIINNINQTIFSSNSGDNLSASLPVPDDRNGILKAGVKLYAQQDENELESFLWSPSAYSFFGIAVDTSTNTQTVCIFDARFTKPVYTFYTSTYTTLTSFDAISYLVLTTSGAIVAYNILGSVLHNITANISGYTNYRLTINDSNVLSILANNSSGSVVTLTTFNQTWGTYENTLLSYWTGSAYYGGRVLTSSSGDYILSLDNGSLNINNVIDSSYNSSRVKDIYNYTLYSQLYKYTGTSSGNVHARLMPNGTFIVCEWPTSYLMWGDWFYAYPGIPPQSYNRLNDGNWVYMYYDGTYTKMVTDTGEARYYTGPISYFNSNNWSTYSLAYDSASQQSHYNLNLVPLHTFGTPNVGIPGYKLILGNTGELAIYDNSIPRAAAIDSGSISQCPGWSSVYNMFTFASLLNSKPPWGIYAAESYSNNTLYELRGNGRNATCSGVTLTNGNGYGATANIPYIYGTTTSKVTWPNGSIPSIFTVCSITRYTGTANNKRILNGTSGNWLHGHWSNYSGVCYYEAWKTSSVNGPNNTNWVITCGKNNGNNPNNVLVNGSAKGTASGGTGGQTSMTINNSTAVNEPSDWAFSHVFIWDQTLTDDELKIVSTGLSQYLNNGISIKNIIYGSNNYRWLWNTANSYSSAPVGTVNFYTTYTNTRTTDITATLYYSVDDTLDVYMNGIKLTSGTVPLNVVWAVTITLKAGSTSLFKFVAKNGGSTPNPAGLIFWCLENGNTNDATNTLFFSNPDTVYCSDGIVMGAGDFGIQTWSSGTAYSETIPYPNYSIDTSDIPENQLINIEYNFKIPSSDSDTEEYTKIYSQNRLYYLRLEIDGTIAIYLSNSSKRIWSNRRPYSGPNNAARIGFVYGSDGNGTFGLWDSKGLSYGYQTIPVIKGIIYTFYLGNDRILRLVGSNGTSVIFNP